jgi:hypothetical protein
LAGSARPTLTALNNIDPRITMVDWIEKAVKEKRKERDKSNYIKSKIIEY